MNENVNKLGYERLVKLYQAASELVDSSTFQSDVIGIRKNWHIPVHGLKNDDDIANWFLLDEPKHTAYEELSEEIKATIIDNPKYGLTDSAIWFLYSYVLDNDYFIFDGIMPDITTKYDDKQSLRVENVLFYQTFFVFSYVTVYFHICFTTGIIRCDNFSNGFRFHAGKMQNITSTHFMMLIKC